MIKEYLENIAQISVHNDQREESYYPAMAILIEKFANSIGQKNISITILPKKTEAGNPDFRIWNGDNKITGYIEAKIPESDLNRVEISAQLKRYINTFPNIILTNFYEFRLYRQGKLIEKTSIAHSSEKLKIKQIIENQLDFERLLQRFFDFSLPKIFTAENLALELAKRTRFLRDEIISVELQNTDNKNYIRGFFNAFQRYLIAGLKEYEFADLYSQTVTYAMFAAKTRTKQENSFNRRKAIESIPPTIGILRDIFEFISLGKLPQQMQVIIDDIAEILNIADVQKILQDFYKQGKGEDPIIHFYETFLNQYDPETREKRGVFYTPESVVKYIVNSVDEILIKDFNKIGFADTSIHVLDPAGGTLTFLAEATKKAIETFVDYFGEGSKQDFIKNHILRNFYSFELMMSPYAIAHLKMSYLLQEQGYTLQDDDRFQLYLTNTLESEMVEMPNLPGLSSLAEESSKANIIKKETPILAIIGNPPYSFDSYNKSVFEKELMKLYKKDLSNERNIKILSDDYVKFIRFCHWKIEQSGKGVIGLITKNTYLNIAAAKSMRKQLLLTFDKIYILNLHGKLYEKTPEGSKDQNVFDIRVGTAILLLVKSKNKENTDNLPYAKLYYKDLYGEREVKYDFLRKNTLLSTFTESDELKIGEPHFFFEKKNFQYSDLYHTFWSLNEIFIEKSSGVVTGRDHFIIDDDENVLKNRILSFISSKESENTLKQKYALADRSDFKVEKAKNAMKDFNNDAIKAYCYKPFIQKCIYYEKHILTRDRRNFFAKNFIDKTNLGLITTRRQAANYFNNIFITEKITDMNFLGVGSLIIPLWIYKQNGDALNGNDKYRMSNIHPKIEELLQKVYEKQAITEEIFYYIYAILHSNIYRLNFIELLKIDYPKIPLTNNVQLFEKLAELGKQLANTHLLKSPKINKPRVRFQGQGNGKIEKAHYIENQRIIKINETQYFDNISAQLWHFEIGKNRVIQQFIKRKEKIEFNDAVEFSRIATAIYETFDLQKEIDNIYPELVNDLIKNQNE